MSVLSNLEKLLKDLEKEEEYKSPSEYIKPTYYGQYNIDELKNAFLKLYDKYMSQSFDQKKLIAKYLIHIGYDTKNKIIYSSKSTVEHVFNPPLEKLKSIISELKKDSKILIIADKEINITHPVYKTLFNDINYDLIIDKQKEEFNDINKYSHIFIFKYTPAGRVFFTEFDDKIQNYLSKPNSNTQIIVIAVRIIPYPLESLFVENPEFDIKSITTKKDLTLDDKIKNVLNMKD